MLEWVYENGDEPQCLITIAILGDPESRGQPVFANPSSKTVVIF